jgi:hypothetical protein
MTSCPPQQPECRSLRRIRCHRILSSVSSLPPATSCRFYRVSAPSQPYHAVGIELGRHRPPELRHRPEMPPRWTFFATSPTLGRSGEHLAPSPCQACFPMVAHARGEDHVGQHPQTSAWQSRHHRWPEHGDQPQSALHKLYVSLGRPDSFDLGPGRHRHAAMTFWPMREAGQRLPRAVALGRIRPTTVHSIFKFMNFVIPLIILEISSIF